MLGGDEEKRVGDSASLQLLSNEEAYRLLVEQAEDYAMWLMDVHGCIASWNPGVEKVLGYTQDEFVGQNGRITFTPADQEAGEPERELEEALAKGRAVDERWHVRKDGHRFWAQGIVRRLNDASGQAIGVTKVMRDNTQLKHTLDELHALQETLERRVEERTEELRRSEARFSQVFQLAPFAMALVTPGEDYCFLEVNESFERLTGYSRNEVLGRTNRELKLWTSRQDEAQLMQPLTRQQAFRDLELQMTTKGGGVRDVVASGVVVQGDGEPVWLWMFYDVTQRKRSDEEFKRAVHEVMTDTEWFSQALLERLARTRSGTVRRPELAELTRRERQVLEFIAKGRDNETIALELGVAPQTVRNYITSLYSKIGVKSRVEAAVWARERGIGHG